jgi:hypothetical protein
MYVKRIVTLILLLAAGAGSLLYGSLFHQMTVEEEKEREISIAIAIPTMPGPGGMSFDQPGMPPGDDPMQMPMVSDVMMETVIEKYVESQKEPEWIIVYESTFGGIARLANSQLKRTYSGKPPALCPT